MIDLTELIGKSRDHFASTNVLCLENYLNVCTQWQTQITSVKPLFIPVNMCLPRNVELLRRLNFL